MHSELAFDRITMQPFDSTFETKWEAELLPKLGRNGMVLMVSMKRSGGGLQLKARKGPGSKRHKIVEEIFEYLQNKIRQCNRQQTTQHLSKIRRWRTT